MSEQRTLEEVGVKRVRQQDKNVPTPASDVEPQPKKAHTGSAPKQPNSMENKGSSSNVPASDGPPVKDKAVGETEDQHNNSDPPCISDSKPEQHAQQPEVKANAKEPLSPAVAKPEGILLQCAIFSAYYPPV